MEASIALSTSLPHSSPFYFMPLILEKKGIPYCACPGYFWQLLATTVATVNAFSLGEDI